MCLDKNQSINKGFSGHLHFHVIMRYPRSCYIQPYIRLPVTTRDAVIRPVYISLPVPVSMPHKKVIGIIAFRQIHQPEEFPAIKQPVLLNQGILDELTIIS